jgi:hypothetical protein
LDPSDFDGDSDGLSFNDLPPSVRQRAMGAMGYTRPDTGQAPEPTVYGQQQTQPSGTPMPVEEYRAAQPGLQTTQGGSAGNTPPANPIADNAPWLMVGAVAVLGAIGWWAYSKMEKDKKIRVGPPRMRDDGAYGGDDGGFDDDGPGYDDGDDGDGPLDAYAKVKKPRKIVDPHEKGGIKLVKG